MPATMVGRRRKIKKTLAKTSPQKQNFDKYITPGIQPFFIRPQVPADIIRVLFLFQIFLQKVTKPTKTSEKRSFYNSFAQKT